MLKIQLKPDEAIEKIKTLIHTFVKPPRNEILFSMMSGLDFAKAPASSRMSLHGCWKGGLADHTLHVIMYMLRLNDAWECGIDKDSVVLTGFLHDISKAGFMDMPYYVPEESKWHRDNQGRLYNHNPDLPPMDQGFMSIRLADKYQLPLSNAEWLAILCQDGMFGPGEKSVFRSNSEKTIHPLIFITHFSDWYVAKNLKI